MIMAKKGNEDALLTLIRYFGCRIRLYDSTHLNDNEDLQQIKKIAIWQAIKRYTPGDSMRSLMTDCKWKAYRFIPHRGASFVIEWERLIDDLDLKDKDEDLDPKMLMIRIRFEKLVKERANEYKRKNLLWEVYSFLKERGYCDQIQVAKHFKIKKPGMCKIFGILRDLAVTAKKRSERRLHHNHLYLEG